MKNHWLLKSEPNKYSFEQLQKEGATYWDGVRNYQARNNLKLMKEGDLALFYHSNEGKEIVGIARIVKTYYQDPTTDDSNWVVVDVVPYFKLAKPVTLETLKKHPLLKNMALVKQSRLSVMPVTVEEFDEVLRLGEMG